MTELPHALHRATPAELQERIAAERAGGPFLLLRDDEARQRIVALADDGPAHLTIGRGSGCDVRLGWDGEVSRVHARLERVGDEWSFVDDGGSRNGSFVDGRRVQGRRRLRDGDVIVLGATALLFRAPAGGESLRTATSAAVATPVAPAITAAQHRVLTALCRPCAHDPAGVPATNRQIAAELVIGLETVKTHVSALAAAFGLTDLPQHQKRATLARRALETGAVSDADLDGA